MPRLTEEQLAHRSNGMGATDVVEACGLAPWEGSGPMRLFLIKTGQLSEDDSNVDRERYFDWGHRQEGLLLDWYSEDQETTLLPGGHVPHHQYDWLWATLDAKRDDRVVECKHVGPGMAHHWDESSEDGIPRYVRAQVTIQMACLGIRLADVVASVGGRPPHIWTVGWDDELAELLISRALEFWKLVQSRTPPKLDATEATKEWLRRKWPTNEDRVLLPAGPEADDLAQKRIAATIEERKAWTEKTLADAALLDMIGPHDGIRSQDGEWQLTWKLDRNGVRRQRFTARALKEDA